jgi:hypothetical protein
MNSLNTQRIITIYEEVMSYELIDSGRRGIVVQTNEPTFIKTASMS